MILINYHGNGKISMPIIAPRRSGEVETRRSAKPRLQGFDSPLRLQVYYMESKEILEKYLKFYMERGHKQIPNVSLIPENDPTLLYVNSGMFPLVPYLSGQVKHPMGKRLVNVQRAGRFGEDLENVGDATHTTTFHMMGNWSLGDYFKKEQLPWIYEFLVEILGLDINRMYATVFEGDESAPKDEESIDIIKQIFKKHGLEAKEGERIFPRGKEDNWWKRGDAPGELGGPDSEIFYFVGVNGNGFGKDPTQHQEEYLEIGNSVFMQYKKTADGGWEELAQKNVDFGGGLERIALAVQGKQDIYETDNFWPIVQKIQEISEKKYGESEVITKATRVIADHIRASIFLAMDDVVPSNKDQGYILRRLLRRMIRSGRLLGIQKDISVSLVATVCETFSWLYPRLVEKQDYIAKLFTEEEEKFAKTLDKGAKTVSKIYTPENIGSKSIEDFASSSFEIFQSVGYPLELFIEDIKDIGAVIDEKLLNKRFKEIQKDHQMLSRKGAEQKFKGGLADTQEITIKYHTATHLLHWGLRQVFGNGIVQMGSNITGERLRFDFPLERKLTVEEITRVEGLVNNEIKRSLPVNFVVMSKEEAKKTGAIHAFGEKYGETVNVYFIGGSLETAISKEFCGGPHVSNLNELKPISIYKQEGIGNGLQRIYARFSV